MRKSRLFPIVLCPTLLAAMANATPPASEPAHPTVAKAPDKPSHLTLAQVARVQAGMTLVEVMAILGRHAEINPDPAPFAYRGDEVIIVWRETSEKWVGVVFVPDDKSALRVLATGATYLVRKGIH